jgi:parallel beta-helix repeat protein
MIRRLILLVAAAIGLSTQCFAATFYIDPSAATNGIGTQASPYNTWTAVTFSAGNIYLQNAGTTYGSQLNISSVHGTSGAPITIGMYGTGAKPSIHNISVTNSSYVTFQNLTMPFGFVTQIGQSSDHLIVQNNDIQNPTNAIQAGVALWTRGSDTNLLFQNNLIHNSYLHCVYITESGHVSGNGTKFLNNKVKDCGVYGVQVESSSWNTVSLDVIHNTGIHPANSRGGGGGSGLHVENGCYNGQPCGAGASHNTLTKNIIYQVNDSRGDGNCIQIDMAADNTLVDRNLGFGCDGGGVALFKSNNGTISNNVLFNNGMNRQSSHSLCANISVDQNSVDAGGPTSNNSILNNTVIISASVGGEHVCRVGGPFGFDFTVHPTGPTTYGGNKLLNIAASPAHYYHTWSPSATGDGAAAWNAGASVSGGRIAHSSHDIFGNVTINNAIGAPPMDFIIPVGYQISVPYDGNTVTLFGWRADTGLYATGFSGN